MFLIHKQQHSIYNFLFLLKELIQIFSMMFTHRSLLTDVVVHEEQIDEITL